MNKPELLCPAGDAERLEMALHYGADAVYLAGTQFGLRAGAAYFDSEKMRAASELCRRYGAKMYVTINTLPREPELGLLPEYIRSCAENGADAFIIADLGVMAMAKKYAPEVPVHVSTQLGVVNSETARVLYDMGAKRAVLARELSLDEIRAVRDALPPEMELEAFVHGAMCVSFSGRCLLSNYMTGRDANAGECAQPCRWKYYLMEEKRPNQLFEISEDGGTHILNSEDMCMIEHLRELMDAGVSSFKIEGRMKSAYYAAVTAYAYRGAIDDAAAGRPFDPLWLSECMKVSHRRYSTGFYFGKPAEFYRDSMYFSDASVCAVTEGPKAEDGLTPLTQRNKFSVGDRVELISPGIRPVSFTVSELFDGDGLPISTANRAVMPLKMRLPVSVPRLAILRKIEN